MNDDLTNLHSVAKLPSTDAEVVFIVNEYSIGEESGSASVCVDSGVTGGFETALSVFLSAEDGKASE